VHFKIRDVYYPDAADVLTHLHGDDLLQGQVIDQSDSGGPNGAFAVIQVDGIAQPVIVSVQRILGAL
jgi:hypothetical protein